MIKKSFVLENLRIANSFLSGIDAADLDLACYFDGCGAPMCALGWLTTLEHFQKLGIRSNGASGVRYAGMSADEIFGDDAFFALFAMYGSGKFDGEIEGIYEDDDGKVEIVNVISDKDLILHRFARQIQTVSQMED